MQPRQITFMMGTVFAFFCIKMAFFEACEINLFLEVNTDKKRYYDEVQFRQLHR